MTTSNAAIATREYLAFISYRHADNKQQGRQWATWLHQALETYEVPADLVGKTNSRGEVIPERIYPIFRDEDELPAHADLANSITSALANSRLLVVLCSPNAVASTYVADEICFFKKLGHSDRIIAAMIDGEPNASWDTAKQASGVPAEAECFPLPLQFTVDEEGELTTQRAEPIAADFRVNLDGKTEQGWTNVEALRQHLKTTTKLTEPEIKATVSGYQQQQQLMLLKIIAGILGVPLGELTKRDQAYQLEQQRKKAKRLRQWLSGVAVLALLATGAGIYAWQQRAEAIAQRDKAETAKTTAETAHGLALIEKAERAFELQLNNEGHVYAAHALARLVGKKFEKPTADQIASLIGQRITHPGVELMGTLRGAKEKVVDLAYSPDGKTLASLGENNKVLLWDTASGELNATLQPTDDLKNVIAQIAEDPQAVRRIIYSPDSKTLALAVGNEIRLLNAASGKLLNTLKGSPESILNLVYSPDGKVLASASSRSIHLWDASAGKLMTRFLKGGQYLVFSPDSKLLASRGDYGVDLRDVGSGELKATAQINDVSGLDYSADGKILTILHDSFRTEIDTSNGVTSEPIYFGSLNGPDERIIGITNFPGGKIVVLEGLNSTIRILDFANGNLIAALSSNKGFTYSLGSKAFATVGGDNTIQLWDAASINNIHIKKRPGEHNIRFSPDGNVVASYRKENAYLLDLNSGELIATLLGGQGEISALVYSADGKVLASSNWFDPTVRLWDAATGKPITTFVGDLAKSNSGSVNGVMSLALSSNGKFLAVGYFDGTIRLWEISSGKTVIVLRGNGRPVKGLAYSPNGKALASVNNDGRIIIWDVKSGNALGLPKLPYVVSDYLPGTDISYSRDGKFLALLFNGVIHLCNATSGELIATIRGDEVHSFVFSPNGKTLTFSRNGGIFLWDIARHELITSLPNAGRVDRLGYTPNGKTLFYRTFDGIRRYYLPSNPLDINWVIQSAKDEAKYGFWLEGVRLVSFEQAKQLRESRNNMSDGPPPLNKAASKVDLAGKAIVDKPVELDPSYSTYMYKLSISHDKLGDRYNQQGDHTSALKAYQSGMAILEKLLELEPSNTTHMHNLSISHDYLGNSYHQQGDYVSALKAYQSGMAIREKLVELEPSSTTYLHSLSFSHDNIGDSYRQLGDYASALKAYQSGMAIREKIVAMNPKNTKFQVSLLASYSNIAQTYSKEKEFVLAEKTMMTGIVNAGIDVQGQPLTVQNRHLLNMRSGSYLGWSWYALLTQKTNQVPVVLEKVIDYLPENKDETIELHSNLAHAYLLTGDFKAAKSIYEKYKGYKFQDGNTWDKTIIADFEALKENGVKHESFSAIAKEVFGVELDVKK